MLKVPDSLGKSACYPFPPLLGSAPTMDMCYREAEKRKTGKKKREAGDGESCRRLCRQQRAPTWEFRNVDPGLSSAMNYLGTLDK